MYHRVCGCPCVPSASCLTTVGDLTFSHRTGRLGSPTPPSGIEVRTRDGKRELSMVFLVVNVSDAPEIPIWGFAALLSAREGQSRYVWSSRQEHVQCRDFVFRSCRRVSFSISFQTPTIRPLQLKNSRHVLGSRAEAPRPGSCCRSVCSPSLRLRQNGTTRWDESGSRLTAGV